MMSTTNQNEGLNGTIPGERRRASCEVVYFSDLGAGTVVEQFYRLTDIPPPITIARGGATPENCTLTLPDGSVFHAMEYHGDMQGWANDLTRSAKSLGALLARIDAGNFVISDGRTFSLADCTVIPPRD